MAREKGALAINHSSNLGKREASNLEEVRMEFEIEGEGKRRCNWNCELPTEGDPTAVAGFQSLIAMKILV